MPIHALPGRENPASSSTSLVEMEAETKGEGVTETKAVGAAVEMEEKVVVAATEAAVETKEEEEATEAVVETEEEATEAEVVEAVAAEAGAGQEVAVAANRE